MGRKLPTKLSGPTCSCGEAIGPAFLASFPNSARLNLTGGLSWPWKALRKTSKQKTMKFFSNRHSHHSPHNSPTNVSRSLWSRSFLQVPHLVALLHLPPVAHPPYLCFLKKLPKYQKHSLKWEVI